MDDSSTDPGREAGTEPVLLAEPVDGVPPVVTDPTALHEAAAALAAGHGPIAVDTERASGYRYSQRAYLVQLRRAGAGTVLIDPIPFGGQLDTLAAAINDTEWVLHAASQDLPCLAELGLRPVSLFDTELAGRLAGYPRVALGSLVEQILGYRLEKGHGAADWSQRPLPADWLSYAALDVELLTDLREALAAELDAQGKLAWALEEFDAVRTAPGPQPRTEPWRRTSGIHRVRNARHLAVIRSLWEARDAVAVRRDISPGRILPDSAIVAAAVEGPPDRHALIGMPVFRGRAQRRLADVWWEAIAAARDLPASELPDPSPPHDGPPPPNRWADREPAAAARLTAARAALKTIAEDNTMPVENLVQPDLVRRICWQPPVPLDGPSVVERLRAGGARSWQVELTADALTAALHAEPA